jgi:hypothetical protein
MRQRLPQGVAASKMASLWGRAIATTKNGADHALECSDANSRRKKSYKKSPNVKKINPRKSVILQIQTMKTSNASDAMNRKSPVQTPLVSSSLKRCAI